MKHPKTAVLLLALLAALYGCVSLTGQRFTWFHDVLKDTFYILIQYDGIHEGTGENKPGKDQIPKFIADGDVMFLDWFGHVRMRELEGYKTLPDPVESEAAKLPSRVEVELVGRYREPDGRVGAAQLVTIRDFKAFLKEGNRLINAALARLDREKAVARSKKGNEMWRTLDNILGAAKAGHTWVKVKGHALQVAVPFDREEWAEAKGEAVLELVREVARQLDKESKNKKAVENVIRSLAAIPFSLVESHGMVTLTVGDPLAPRTFHIQYRDEYNKDLEAVVAKNVKVDLDAELRRLLHDKDAKPSEMLRRVKHWLPAEVEVGALLAATKVRPEVADPERDRAIERLRVIGHRWNEDRGHPTAPIAKGMRLDDYLKAWSEWYARRRRLKGNRAW